MNRLLLVAILGALLWSGVELHGALGIALAMNRVLLTGKVAENPNGADRDREAPLAKEALGPPSVTIHNKPTSVAKIAVATICPFFWP